MRKRLNSKKIYKVRSREVSKTESERVSSMKNQRFSDDKIRLIQEKLIRWDIEHSWKCACNSTNKDLIFICPHCARKKPLK